MIYSRYTIILFLVCICYFPLQAQNAAQKWYTKGMQATDLNDKINSFSKAIQLAYEPLADAYYQRGIAQRKNGELDAAIEDYSKAIELDSLNPDFYNSRGLAYNSYHKNTLALNDYGRALELDPNHAQTHFNRGRLFILKQLYKEALADFDIAIKFCQRNCHLDYYSRGYSHYKLENYEQAIADWKKMKTLAPSYSPQYNYMEDAELKLKAGFLLDPPLSAQEWFTKGVTSNDFKEKIKSYTNAIRLGYEPLAHPYNHRGWAKAQLAFYEDAISDYDSAIQQLPNYAKAYINRGYSHLNMQEFEAAQQDFDTAIQLKPDDAELYNLKGYSHFKLGEYAQAIALWDTMKTTSPTHQPAFNYIAAAEANYRASLPPKTKRLALLIGNANYAGRSKLNNPINDATDIGIALANYQFDTTLYQDLDLKGLELSVNNFNKKINAYKEQGFHVTALVYFSGHGLQHNNTNYLIPIGANITNAIDIKYKSYSDERLIDHLLDAHTQIVLIDACRNTPNLRGIFKDLPVFTDGLLVPRVPSAQPVNEQRFKNLCQGTFISFAAAPGTKALDGTGRNSPYVKSFLKVLAANPNLEIRELFREVKNDLFERTNAKQRSWSNDDLIRNFYFMER
ncbi:MAG: caspase family protein [Flammeovirgaceae bacterium]